MKDLHKEGDTERHFSEGMQNRCMYMAGGRCEGKENNGQGIRGSNEDKRKGRGYI